MNYRTVWHTRKMIRRFRRDRSGVAAIELAFVILPFLMLTLGTLEIALIHLLNSSLSNAVNDALRPIYTGGAGCTSVDDLRNAICSRVTLFGPESCLANTKVVLEELAGFGAGSSFNDFDSINEVASAGKSESVMMMQVFYRWDTIIPLMDGALGGDNGELVISETTAFRNEPFGDGGGCP